MSDLTRDPRQGVADTATPTELDSPARFHDRADLEGSRQTLELAEEFASVEIVREELGLVRVRTVTDSIDDVVSATVRGEIWLLYTSPSPRDRG